MVFETPRGRAFVEKLRTHGLISSLYSENRVTGLSRSLHSRYVDSVDSNAGTVSFWLINANMKDIDTGIMPGTIINFDEVSLSPDEIKYLSNHNNTLPNAKALLKQLLSVTLKDISLLQMLSVLFLLGFMIAGDIFRSSLNGQIFSSISFYFITPCFLFGMNKTHLAYDIIKKNLLTKLLLTGSIGFFIAGVLKLSTHIATGCELMNIGSILLFLALAVPVLFKRFFKKT